jgi:hypothetical protein
MIEFLTSDQVKLLRDIVRLQMGDECNWIRERSNELRNQLQPKSGYEVDKCTMQAIEEWQWKKTVALVNLALNIYSNYH